ncbi:MAG: radical SAM protein [Deltaproteobacteria bacterium]|jgi:23S rRNA (adenine2503-C2)-methyltransferase|nr:radical SAM protein [Deltaproteobacteria bacterium]
MIQTNAFEILSKTGDPEIAEVYVAKFRGDSNLLAEFVEARDPDVPKDEKWVIIVSTQFGCPVGCSMCDAGGDFRGNLTADEIFGQIDYIIGQNPLKRLFSVEKFKIQFARMGEPTLNPAVLDVLRDIPKKYDASGLIPCIATVAPTASRDWLENLLEIRCTEYMGRPFQLQLSINSTDEVSRDKLMPVSKIGFKDLSNFAQRFFEGGPRKVALNFALSEGNAIEPRIIADNFDSKTCCVKITPLNPTYRSRDMGLKTALPPDAPNEVDRLCNELQDLGFDVILSIGDTRENQIGSNCGMAVMKMRES